MQTHRRPPTRISLSTHLVKHNQHLHWTAGSLLTSHFSFLHRLHSLSQAPKFIQASANVLEEHFWERFEVNPREWTFRALLLEPSLALQFERLFNEGGTTCSTGHALLGSDPLELENDHDLAKILTPEPTEQARAGARSSSELLSDRNANGERPAKRPKFRASILSRVHSDSTVATEQTSQQRSEFLVERDRYMEHIHLHNLGSYYNQDHGYFNTHGLWKDNRKLFPGLGDKCKCRKSLLTILTIATKACHKATTTKSWDDGVLAHQQTSLARPPNGARMVLRGIWGQSRRPHW